MLELLHLSFHSFDGSVSISSLLPGFGQLSLVISASSIHTTSSYHSLEVVNFLTLVVKALFLLSNCLLKLFISVIASLFGRESGKLFFQKGNLFFLSAHKSSAEFLNSCSHFSMSLVFLGALALLKLGDFLFKILNLTAFLFVCLFETRVISLTRLSRA